MKKTLVLVWMAFALPAWAADRPLEAPLEKMPGTPGSAYVDSTYVEIRGKTENVNSLLDKVRNEDLFKASNCKIIPAHKRSKKLVRGTVKVGIVCAQPDSPLLRIFQGPGVQSKMTTRSSPGCPPGCWRYPCPTLDDPLACCTLEPPFEFCPSPSLSSGIMRP